MHRMDSNGSSLHQSQSKYHQFIIPTRDTVLTKGPTRLPKRDWRDWFIMATVMGGVGYGLYFVTKVRILGP